MRNRFDYLSRRIGKDALATSGTIVAGDVINTETQYADLRHEPDPARHAERARLGLLGRLAATPCLIEVYSQAPRPEDIRACLTKHLAHWQDCARRTRSKNHAREPDQLSEKLVTPFLWIIAAGTPKSVLTQLRFEAWPDGPAGVYTFGGEVLHVGIVAANELPRDPTTLLVRIMAAGPLLASAVDDVRLLPLDAPERVIAEPALLDFVHQLGQRPDRTDDEKEFIVAMQSSWEDARAEGRTEGRTEAQAKDLLTVLRVRGIAVPEGARQRIQSQKDPEQLERWLEKASVATSIGDVIDDPS
jgi:hypothetical protein